MAIVDIPLIDPKKRYLGEQQVGKAWQPRGSWDFSSPAAARITVTPEIYADAQAYADGLSLPSDQSMTIDGPELLALLVKHQAALEAIQADIEEVVAGRLRGVAEPSSLAPLIAAMQAAAEPDPES